MATEILRPNAAGTNETVTNSTGDADHYTCVDEETPDELTTVIWCTGNVTGVDTYALPDHSEGSGTINHVKVYFRIASSHEGADPLKGKAAIYVVDTIYYGDEETTATQTFVTYSHQWNTNPKTGAAWTWDDIDALEGGVYLDDTGVGSLYCTQVYVEVDYAAVTPKTSSDTGSGVDAYVSLEQEVAKSSSDTGSGVDAYVSLEQGVAKSSSDAGSGVESTPMQATTLADSELGQGSDSLIAKIETPTKGGGTKLWT